MEQDGAGMPLELQVADEGRAEERQEYCESIGQTARHGMSVYVTSGNIVTVCYLLRPAQNLKQCLERGRLLTGEWPATESDRSVTNEWPMSDPCACLKLDFFISAHASRKLFASLDRALYDVGAWPGNNRSIWVTGVWMCAKYEQVGCGPNVGKRGYVT